MPIYKKILVGTDGSENAERALEKIRDAHENWKSEIVVFHSYEHHLFPRSIPISTSIPYGSAYTIPASDYNQIKNEYKVRGEKILARAEQIFNTKQVPMETRLIEGMGPEEYIIQVAKNENFDLVALGCKGHSKLEEIFIGSVAKKVLNKAPCDILIVR
ncbi:MAG: hypothetical protein GF353_20840 [Candidatus Lokiarchaeota archaeon]|nr:hypothetical protein [Candidatus Lokiarchaeota archaeon]